MAIIDPDFIMGLPKIETELIGKQEQLQKWEKSLSVEKKTLNEGMNRKGFYRFAAISRF